MKPSAFKEAVFPLAIVAISAWAARAQQPPDFPALELGKSVEREMAPGQTHSYRLTLAAGQYAEIEVQQRRLDVVLTLFDPNGKKLIEVDGPGGRDGLELLTLVVDITGTYRLDIHPLEKDAPAGRYIAILKMMRAATAKDRPLVEARGLLNEAIALQFKGKYDEAAQLAERGLAIRIETLGPDDLAVAAAHDRLGTIFHWNGEFAKAAAAHRQSLEIRKKRLGADHPTTAQSAHNLALDYKVQGDYARAEPLFRGALESFEKAPEPNPQHVATAADQLAGIYAFLGDYAKAEPLFHRALEIREKTFGPNHFEVAISLNNFAVFYARLKQYAKAIEFHDRVLAIKTKRFGTDHPELAITLNNLAGIYFIQGDYEQAKRLYERALAILEKINNRSVAFDLAESLNGLALLYQRESDFARAESSYRRVLDLREKLLGPEHPLVEQSLVNLFALNRDRKDAGQAMSFLMRGQEIHERNVSHDLLTGSERQKLAYLDLYVGQVSQAISLHVQLAPDDAQAKQIALETLLRRKGRVLDVMADSIARLRRHANPESQALFDQLTAVRSQLAALTLRGPEFFGPASHRAKLKSLNEQMEKLEGEISARSAEFKSLTQPITLAEVQKAIPRGAALVEFALYSPFDWQTRNPGALRYVAYVLSSEGAISWADLGVAEEIDRAVDAFRLALGSHTRTDVKRIARRMDEKVMRRVRPLLGGARRVFLSPDGALGLIPFAALVDSRGDTWSGNTRSAI